MCIYETFFLTDADTEKKRVDVEPTLQEHGNSDV